MAGKNSRKHHQPSGDTQEISEGGVDERSLLEIFISNQTKRDEEAEERRVREKKEQLEAESRARKEQLDAELRAEERRLKAEIAAEEREEKRRERAKIAEEERMEARALEKERRKREEARKAEEVNREKEEAARKAAEKITEMQEEAAKKAFEQQKELLELQADLGRRAAETHRLENDRSRQRDRAIAGLNSYQKGEDVEEFLLTIERKMRLGDIPEEDWLTLVASRLNGEVGASWQELCMGEGDYQSVRASLLKGCGYTPRAAGEAYHAFRYEHLRGLAGDQVYRKGAQLLKRMVAPLVMDKEMEFRLVKPWVYASVGRRARAVLDARVVTDAESLVRGLQDYLASEGDGVSGKTAVFGGESSNSRRQNYSSEPEKEGRKAGMAGGNSGSSMKCFKCGKMGHKAADCWQGGAGKQEEGSSSKIVCYICGVEGHKATTCPGKKEAQKGANIKQVQQIRLTEEEDTIIQGKVNGRGASLVLDSGAHITIVPEDMVEEKLKTGECVVLRGFQAETSRTVPTAKVKFEVDGMDEWEETVALAPAEEGKETEVIFGLRLTSPRGLNLVTLANRLGEAEVEVKGVIARTEIREEDSGQKENARVVEAEKPKIRSVTTEAVKVPVRKPVAVGVEAVEVVRKAMEAAKPKRRKRVVGPKPSSLATEVVSKQSTGAGELVADRPASNPKPVTQVAGTTGSDSLVVEVDSCEEEEWPDWSGMADSGEEKVEMVSEDQGELLGEVEYCLRKGGRVEDSGVPPVAKGPRCRDKILEGVKSDPSIGAIEPKLPAVSGREKNRKPEYVFWKIARVTKEEPKAKEETEQNKKQIVETVTEGDHAKDVETVDEFGRAAEAVKEERGGRSDTASRKSASILAPQSGVGAVPREQNKVAAVKQKVRLKPVRALDVVLRASAVEQARLEKIAKARQETPRRAEEEMMEDFGFELNGLGARAEEARVKDLCIKKDDFVVELREENEDKREKKYDRVSAVLSSMSSKPAPSVVCRTAEGLETFAGREVSCVDVCLPTLPTQDWDSRLGDPKQEAGGGTNERTKDPRQQKAGGGTKERFGDPRQLEAGGGASGKPGGPWLIENKLEKSVGVKEMENGLEESVEDEPGLRPAPSCVVGGDVGSESPQKEGVATSGVALQRLNKEREHVTEMKGMRR